MDRNYSILAAVRDVLIILALIVWLITALT